MSVWSDPNFLRDRAGAVADALRAAGPHQDPVPTRIAASVTQLGLTARLSAVALAAAVDGLPVPSPDQLVYRDQLPGPIPLGLRPRPPGGGPILPWPEALLALVVPIADATIDSFRLSPRVVWGNVASGLYGAARMMAEHPPTARAASAEDLLAAALARDPLRGTLTEVGLLGRRRRSCCLIYRLAQTRSAVCSDCVLAPA